MIITCTLNPAIDYHLYSDHFEKGKLNRVTEYQFDLGGKGINVSKTLNQLACKSRSITILNKELKVFYKKTMRQTPYIKYDIVNSKSLTRFNVKLHGKKETEVNTTFEKVTGSEIHEIRKKLQKIKHDDMLIFSGSCIKGEPYLYDSLISQTHKINKNIIIDIPAELYDQVLKYEPLLVKPNKDELKTYFKLEEDVSDYVPYCKQLIEQGARNIVLSLGEEGSLLVTKDYVYRISLDQIQTNKTVGAGDAFVAGFAYQYQKDQNLLKAYKFGHATSYAFVAQEQIGIKDVEAVLKKINVEEIL